MALEPTADQLEAIARVIYEAGHQAPAFEICVVELKHDAYVVWPVIRDMVLEEAAKVLDRNVLRMPPYALPRLVRDLKGQGVLTDTHRRSEP